MNIIITSAGRRSYIVKYFQDALAGDGLVHAGNSELSAALLAADKYVLTPLIYDSEYIDFLINYCKSNEITAILSLFDVDLPVLAMARERFIAESIFPIVSAYNVIAICNDKWETYKFLISNNFKSPATYIDLYDVMNDISDGVVQYPVILKPRWGMGSVGISTADNAEELQILYRKLKNDIFKTYLKYESQEDPDKSIIIQEMILGDEYGLDVINDLNQKYVCTFVKRKIAMRSGETDSAITVNNSPLENAGAMLGEKLGHIGNLDVDCFIVDNKPYILEMNCRFGGGYPFSHMAGANIPLAIIHWLNKKIPPDHILKIKAGVLGVKDITPIVLKQEIS
ncbi:MAG TPA: ATP-grasp domain-containing protein [Spirochaetota bacterium]|nr:ATP-grasp domain-containing protein [Spirochaetota bacterium]